LGIFSPDLVSFSRLVVDFLLKHFFAFWFVCVWERRCDETASSNDEMSEKKKADLGLRRGNGVETGEVKV